MAGPPARPSLTEGPVFRTLIGFSLPILASNVLQSLNASINSVWIGRLLGERALSAGANANSLIFFLLGAVFGLGLASTVLIGQAVGAKNDELVKRTIGTCVTVFGLVSVALAGAGIAFAPQLLVLMHTPADSLPYASEYLRVIFVALPGMYLYALVMMVLRGAGDAKTPFFFSLLSTALDIGLNPLLIRGVGPFPKLGIAGSATASLVAQWTALVGLIAWLYWRKHPIRLARGEFHYLRIDGQILKTLVVKGVPMGLQVTLMSASMLVMISFVNQYGSTTTAAYGACFQLWSYVQMPAFAVGAAVSSMAAQNVGASRWDRVAEITRAGLTYSVALTTVLVLLITLLDRPAFVMFLGPDSPSVPIAMHVHLIGSWSFVLLGMSFVLSSVVRSTGAVLQPLAILFVSLWVVRIPFAFALRGAMGPEAIWWSFPIGSAVSLALSALYYRFGRWREARMLVPRAA